MNKQEQDTVFERAREARQTDGTVSMRTVFGNDADRPKRGRPFTLVPREKIDELRRDRWKWHEIAAQLGISRATAMRIYKRGTGTNQR